MTASSARSRADIRMQMVWAIGLLLVLDLVPFVIVKLALHASVRMLAGPYLAFAASRVILLLLSWGLRIWEERGAAPGRLALGWGLSVALFTSALAAVIVYSGAQLHLIGPSDLWIVAVAYAAGVPISFFSMYHMALTRISARAAK